MKAIIIICTFLVITFPSFAQVPTTGLVAEYLFENGSYDDTNPNSYGPNNATAPSIVTSTTDRFGNQNYAKDLLGIHAFEEEATYIDLGSSSVLKPTKGTISIWVNVDAISTSGWGYTYNPVILAKNTNSPGKYMEAYALYIHIDEKTPRGRTVNPPETITEVAGAKIKFNEWHHYTITYDEASLKLYVDGVFISQKNKTYTTLFSTDRIYIGSSMNESNNRAFDGQVDDVRIYNRVLNQSEVTALYEEEDPNISHTYAELKQQLDGGYIQLDDDFLRIKFNQEYGVDGSGEKINYTIYRWDRTSYSGIFNATYGINWEDLDLSGFNLNNDEHYTIEFEANKGEKYILRFKTKPSQI